MGIDYAWEKLYNALRYALASDESVQGRLESVIADVSHLHANSFPDDACLWEEFQELIRETTKVQARIEHRGTIHATTSQMTDEEAARWLQKAFDIFSDVARAYGKTKTVRP